MGNGLAQSTFFHLRYYFHGKQHRNAHCQYSYLNEKDNEEKLQLWHLLVVASAGFSTANAQSKKEKKQKKQEQIESIASQHLSAMSPQ